MAGENGGTAGGSGGRKIWRISLWALLLVWFLSFLSCGIIANCSAKVTRGRATLPLGHFKQVKLTGRRKGASNLNYVSKRKVPNGPDPIHNRHVGPSRQTSGRV